jgi:hypothetical protein
VKTPHVVIVVVYLATFITTGKTPNSANTQPIQTSQAIQSFPTGLATKTVQPLGVKISRHALNYRGAILSVAILTPDRQ